MTVTYTKWKLNVSRGKRAKGLQGLANQMIEQQFPLEEGDGD
ncbi:MAG: hypothetical protein ACJ71A_01735 [Nitrososphaeraceae archaeon]